MEKIYRFWSIVLCFALIIVCLFISADSQKGYAASSKNIDFLVNSLTKDASQEEELPLIFVSTQPLIHVIQDETSSSQESDQEAQSQSLQSFSTIANDRTPLGIITAGQEIKNQKWYIVASAKRGIHDVSDILEIVSTGENDQNFSRGEEIKTLLIEEGISPMQIRLLKAREEDENVSKIYLFSKKDW